jgi:tetrathionate reductase subunit B
MGYSDRKFSRREIVKTAGLGAAVATTTVAVPKAASAALAPGHQVQYAMVIDVRKCVGCHACTVACKTEFEVPLGKNRSWVESIEKGSYPDVSRSFLPRLCNHCSKPQCVTVCPTGATYKREEDGIVVVDEDLCIGCKYCIQACPYDARFINPMTGTADKCDFCLHRVEKGLAPSCVNTCQGEARVFGDMNDPESDVAKLIAMNPVTVLRRDMGMEPNVYYIGADHADESDIRVAGQYLRVDTNRPDEERR